MLLPEAPWTRAMADGSVRAPGMSWECVTDAATVPERFSAAASGGYDVGEAGIRSLLLDSLQGAAPRALPVWLGREHMQRNFIVRKDSPLKGPADLAGKRIASRQPVTSGTSAGVMLMLEQFFESRNRGEPWPNCPRFGSADRLPPAGPLSTRSG